MLSRKRRNRRSWNPWASVIRTLVDQAKPSKPALAVMISSRRHFFGGLSELPTVVQGRPAKSTAVLSFMKQSFH